MRAVLRAAERRDERDGAACARRVWVSPTVGGQFEMRHMLNWTAEYTASSWDRGYCHAAELDRTQRYWRALEPWRRQTRDDGPVQTVG